MRPYLRAAPLVVFLSAGPLKLLPGASVVPGDLTVMAALVVALHGAVALVGRGFQVPRQLVHPVVLFLLMLPAVLWCDSGSYSLAKVSRLYTLTLLAAVAPLVIVRRWADLRAFLVLVSAIGMAAASWALFGEDQLANQYTKLSLTEGASTVGLARLSGAALVGLVLVAFTYRRRFIVPALLATLIPALALIATTGQGPALAAVIALAVVIVLPRTAARRRWVRALAIGAVGVVGALGSLRVVGDYRASAVLNVGVSEYARTQAYERSFGQILANPAGIGWGDFSQRIPLYFGPEPIAYPHNLWIETMLEGGLVAGVFLLYLTVVALRGVRRLKPDFTALLLQAHLVYWLVNAGVSGDINSNRSVFAFVSLAFVASRLQPLRQDSSPEPASPIALAGTAPT
jgi:O-antigen ligase